MDRLFSSAKMVPGSEVNPWDIQPRESARSYQAFTMYRDLGFGRTLQRVATSLSLSLSRVAQLSRAHNWKGRVRAWIQEQDRQRQEALMERRCRTIDQQLSLAEAMRSMAYQRLQLLVGDPERPDLASLQAQLAVKDIARMAAVACEIERSILCPIKGKDSQTPAEIHISLVEKEPERQDQNPDTKK